MRARPRAVGINKVGRPRMADTRRHKLRVNVNDRELAALRALAAQRRTPSLADMLRSCALREAQVPLDETWRRRDPQRTEDATRFGAAVWHARTQRQWTMRDLAAKAGMATWGVLAVEQGREAINPVYAERTRLAITAALGLDPWPILQSAAQ